MLSVVMMNVITLSVVIMNVVTLSVVMMCVIMLSVVMLSVAMMSDAMLSVVILSAVMLSIIMRSVVLLNVETPLNNLRQRMDFVSYLKSFETRPCCKTFFPLLTLHPNKLGRFSFQCSSYKCMST
jgi:hypothetical protein